VNDRMTVCTTARSAIQRLAHVSQRVSKTGRRTGATLLLCQPIFGT
jgi:hypothetical protein